MPPHYWRTLAPCLFSLLHLSASVRGEDILVRAGQDRPLSVADSMRAIQLDGLYEVQLVAAEPLVLDPVECTWDSKGRLYVADMCDYPVGPANPSDPWLSRIQCLFDIDGDGKMDRAVTFANHLDHVQGLLPYRDGLIATTRTQILFLRDTNDDGVADEIVPLINGFNPRFSQLQVSAPRWGPDGWVYFNNGLDGKEIYPADAPEAIVGIPRSNFRWDPKTKRIEATSGFGQYGAAFDDFGRYFFCSNRNPVMCAVMPFKSVHSNPRSGIERGWEDIAPAGSETRIYPLSITHTTADAHAGTNTACSGIGVYRGELMPELRNNVFVPDPTGQLITRYRIEPSGASFRAIREGQRTEFFRSGDEWCRPVNITTGPDGALYVCDMYRRWIDHARFFPDEFVKGHDMREGEMQGRIWRIVPKGFKEQRVEMVPDQIDQLRKWANHPNGWHAETAKRLLAEKGELHETPEVPQTEARKIFHSILSRSDAELDPDLQTVSQRVAALVSAPEDEWTGKAVLAASNRSSGHVLSKLVGEDSYVGVYSKQRGILVQALASASASSSFDGDFFEAVNCIYKKEGRLTWWKAAVIQGLSEGIPKAKSMPWGRSLSACIESPRPEIAAAVLELERLVKQMDVVVLDPVADPSLRLVCLSLLKQRRWEEVGPLLRKLMQPTEEPRIQATAVSILKGFGGEKAGGLVYELMGSAAPQLRQELVGILSASPKTAVELFRRMDRGEVSAALIDMETRWRYQRGTGELAELATKLFGQKTGNRSAVVSSYGECIKVDGNAVRGRQLFESLCTGCHRIDGVGEDVGPSLSDVKIKAPEALLSDILDPNRMVEARYGAYQIEMQDGRSLVGLISSETGENVTLILPGGHKEILSRESIKSLGALDRSLMPEGMEALLSKEQMSDLLSFLRQK